MLNSRPHLPNPVPPLDTVRPWFCVRAEDITYLVTDHSKKQGVFSHTEKNNNRILE